MQLQVHALLRDAVQSTIRSLWNIEVTDVVLNQTPKIELGELATPICFELAKKLKKAPKACAEELIRSLGEIPGVRKIELAGAGYINFFLNRAVVLRDAFEELVTRKKFTSFPSDAGKVVVEAHKYQPEQSRAHRASAKRSDWDTFIRVLKACGRHVEVQNYIDNTGVQVADVIVGFKYLEKKSVSDVRRLIADESIKFRLLLLGSLCACERVL
jgi:arginyl-tRNA synthetase